MTDKDRKQTKNEARQPDHIGYSVKDRGPEKDAVWTRVAAAWEHRDGKGFDIQMEAMPVDGRLTLRENRREEFLKRREDERAERNVGRDRSRSRS